MVSVLAWSWRALAVLIVVLAVASLPVVAMAKTTVQSRAMVLPGEWASGITAAAFPQWTKILEEPRTYQVARRIAGQATSGPDVMADLRRVNRTVNSVRYVADRPGEGRLNPWRAPHEFLTRGGDCEDYVIAKYFALRALGLPAEALRILFVKDRSLNLPHAVLLVRVEGRDLVLDNQSNQIRPWAALKHYRPIYSVNETGVWLHRG